MTSFLLIIDAKISWSKVLYRVLPRLIILFYPHSHYGQKWSQRCWFTRYKRKLLEIFHWPSSKTIESYFVLFSRWKNFESSRKKISGFNQLHMYWLVSWGKPIFLMFSPTIFVQLQKKRLLLDYFFTILF